MEARGQLTSSSSSIGDCSHIGKGRDFASRHAGVRCESSGHMPVRRLVNLGQGVRPQEDAKVGFALEVLLAVDTAVVLAVGPFQLDAYPLAASKICEASVAHDSLVMRGAHVLHKVAHVDVVLVVFSLLRVVAGVFPGPLALGLAARTGGLRTGQLHVREVGCVHGPALAALRAAAEVVGHAGDDLVPEGALLLGSGALLEVRHCVQAVVDAFEGPFDEGSRLGEPCVPGEEDAAEHVEALRADSEVRFQELELLLEAVVQSHLSLADLLDLGGCLRHLVPGLFQGGELTLEAKLLAHILALRVVHLQPSKHLDEVSKTGEGSRVVGEGVHVGERFLDAVEFAGGQVPEVFDVLEEPSAVSANVGELSVQ
mmetsp:Transcript_22715/g.49940  ORF Transcript_22715/g.49940 Transcript_22715/m.49940 type:complete len:370 (+) Transcript_22715:423-1532(+)